MKDRDIAYQIATIKGLKMINFYHLFSNESPLYGILAYYQDKVINLCSSDDHFTALFDRIAKVYDRESVSERIIADEETIYILKQANSFSGSSFEKRLGGYVRSDTALMLPKAFSAYYLLPIVKYVIQALYDKKDPASSPEPKSSLIFDKTPRQWFGKGVLNAMYEDKHLGFPYQIFSMAGECYDILVRNVLSDGNSLKIEISYGYDRISVSYYDHFLMYEGCIQYTMKDSKGLLFHELKQKDDPVFISETECIDNSNMTPSEQTLKLIGNDAGRQNACILPWGDTLFSISAENEEYRIIETQNNDLKISYVLCFHYLNTANNLPFAFGEFSFRLYERSDITELHLLDMEQPACSRFRQNYAGNYYRKCDN